MDPWLEFQQQHFGVDRVDTFRKLYLFDPKQQAGVDSRQTREQPAPRPPPPHFATNGIELSDEMHQFLYQNALRRARRKLGEA
jgi:hypothetical protein